MFHIFILLLPSSVFFSYKCLENRLCSLGGFDRDGEEKSQAPVSSSLLNAKSFALFRFFNVVALSRDLDLVLLTRCSLVFGSSILEVLGDGLWFWGSLLEMYYFFFLVYSLFGCCYLPVLVYRTVSDARLWHYVIVF